MAIAHKGILCRHSGDAVCLNMEDGLSAVRVPYTFRASDPHDADYST